MIEVEMTEIFEKWLKKLKDFRAKSKIEANIKRMQDGNLGSTRFLGEGIFEKKINYGPGYRLYFFNSGASLIILLCGGDKSTQKTDVTQAKKIRKELNE
jgi:putative addiction module killer protein